MTVQLIDLLTDDMVERFWPDQDAGAIRESFAPILEALSQALAAPKPTNCDWCGTDLSDKRHPEARFCQTKCRTAYHAACGKYGDQQFLAGNITARTLHAAAGLSAAEASGPLPAATGDVAQTQGEM